MAILTTFRLSGDPDELLGIVREKLQPVVSEVAPASGRISSTIARTDAGLIIVNVWENEEGMRRTAERVGAIARDSGLPEQEDWQMYEVLDRG
jgi:hypothetical protein